MVALKLASMLYKKVTNPMLCAGIIFAIGAVSATGLCLFTGLNPVFSVIFSAVLTGSMHGVNLMLIGMIPPYFNKYGSVSTVSGILNACTYIGSAISIYGIAILSRGMGWTFTLFVWLGIACAGTAICLLCSIPWKRKMG